jgi:hypothetical protein
MKHRLINQQEYLDMEVEFDPLLSESQGDRRQHDGNGLHVESRFRYVNDKSPDLKMDSESVPIKGEDRVRCVEKHRVFFLRHGVCTTDHEETARRVADMVWRLCRPKAKEDLFNFSRAQADEDIKNHPQLAAALTALFK